MLQDITYILGQDPDRVHRINANSFQQNAITTVNRWQYAAFYTDHSIQMPPLAKGQVYAMPTCLDARYLHLVYRAKPENGKL